MVKNEHYDNPKHGCCTACKHLSHETSYWNGRGACVGCKWASGAGNMSGMDNWEQA